MLYSDPPGRKTTSLTLTFQEVCSGLLITDVDLGRVLQEQDGWGTSRDPLQECED